MRAVLRRVNLLTRASICGAELFHVVETAQEVCSNGPVPHEASDCPVALYKRTWVRQSMQHFSAKIAPNTNTTRVREKPAAWRI